MRHFWIESPSLRQQLRLGTGTGRHRPKRRCQFAGRNHLQNQIVSCMETKQGHFRAVDIEFLY